MFFNKLPLSYLLLFFSIPRLAVLQAAELQLSNGDRLTGEVIRREDGKIFFRSPLLGDLTIAETEALVMATPETPVESLAGLPPEIEVVNLRDAESLRPLPARTDPKPWKGKLEFGYLNQAGWNNVLNYSTRGEAERASAKDSLRLNARYLYGKSNDVLSTNRSDASFRWRHEISERIFGQTLTSYKRDDIAGIQLSAEQNAGFGYNILKGGRQTASAGAGLTYQYREAEGVEQGGTFLGEFFQDYAFKFNGRLSFLQSLNALYSPDGRAHLASSGAVPVLIDTHAEDYKVRFNSTLQGRFSERISLNLRYEYEYDNAILDKNGRTDRRVTSSVGYSF
jgi:putative salt-induced outer membrane protein YdiY